MTRKEKYIALLKDWKTYVFTFLPIIICIITVIVASKFKEHFSNFSLAIVLMFIALILMIIPRIIDLFKRKTKRTIALAIVLIVVTVAMVAVLPFILVDYPKLYAMEEECEVLHQEYLQVDPSDKELANLKHDAWRDAKNDMAELQSSIDLKIHIVFYVWILSVMIVFFLDPKGYGPNTDETEPQDNTPKNDTTIY